MVDSVFREACGIADEENSQFYVTGGVFTERKVSLYGTDGYKRDLPDLNHGRYNHGCAGFHRNNNLVILNITLIIVFTVNLRSSWWQVEASTESTIRGQRRYSRWGGPRSGRKLPALRGRPT